MSLPAGRARLVVVAVVVALGAATCSGGNEAACTELREPEDPGSGLHLIDPGGVTYATHPPTSGPHLSLPTPSGVLLTPLPEAMQVTILEAGGALVQYDAEAVDPAAIATLERLVAEGAVVSPGRELPAPVVATAWTWKLTCESPDTAALAAFVATRPADAPGSDVGLSP